MRQTWIVAAALAVLAAWPAGAQERERARAERERADAARVLAMSFDRGRIGVIVNTDADAEADRLGARIDAVTPGGPADKAGLRAGDVITRFNDVALGGQRAGEEGESGPGMKLVELARALDPGDTVQVEYRRGNDARRATIVAEALSGVFGGFVTPGLLKIDPDLHLNPDVHVFAEPGFAYTLSLGNSWGGVELVKMNADLAEYFGTSDGLLVIRAPADSSLALKGGDVILSIGGRTPTSPSHAMRILRSYEAGEAVRLEVLRRRNRTTVSWTVPERGARVRRLLPQRREREREPA